MKDRKVQMMDAGMRLFETEKPFGTVLGGIKTEMAGYGNILKPNEIVPADLPDTTGECDIFLNWSNKFKTRYISCRLEDAGIVGETTEGEEIHRYAASLKEGNRNTSLGIASSIAGVIVWGLFGFWISKGSWLLTLICVIVGLTGAWRQLRPSRDASQLVHQFLTAFEEAK